MVGGPDLSLHGCSIHVCVQVGGVGHPAVLTLSLHGYSIHVCVCVGDVGRLMQLAVLILSLHEIGRASCRERVW